MPFSQLRSVGELLRFPCSLPSLLPRRMTSYHLPMEFRSKQPEKGKPRKHSVVDPAARPANQHASSNEAQRSPLDNPDLPLRKPSSRDVSVAEQPPANRQVRLVRGEGHRLWRIAGSLSWSVPLMCHARRQEHKMWSPPGEWAAQEEGGPTSWLRAVHLCSARILASSPSLAAWSASATTSACRPPPPPPF